MYDNPISWAILVILAIFAAIWLVKKCEQEQAQYRQEDEDFFWKMDRDRKR